MAHRSRHRNGHEQFRQVVPRRRTRIQSRWPNQISQGPPPRRQTECRLSIVPLPLYFSTSLPHLLFVFSRSRKLDTEQDLYDYALRILMRRAHSVHEMKTKLLRRADSELLAQVVLARLKESGQLDDSRYARQFTRTHAEVRKQGKFRIARDLRARGVPDRHINDALSESAETNNKPPSSANGINPSPRPFRARDSGPWLPTPEMKKKPNKKFASTYRLFL